MISLSPPGMMVVVSGFALAGEQDETRFDFGDRFDRDVKGAAISAATSFKLSRRRVGLTLASVFCSLRGHCSLLENRQLPRKRDTRASRAGPP
ncbi:MAG: hypothetical protein V5B36_14510 [Candidatus Accumulibacter sp. UW25]|jgi:hypothetical protein